MIKPRRCLTAQSPINAISMPAEAAAAVSTRATARVRKYGPCRRQLEGSGGGDTRSCTRCAAVGSEPGGRAMDCTSVVAKLPTIRAVMCVNQLSDLTGPDSVPTVERKTNTPLLRPASSREFPDQCRAPTHNGPTRRPNGRPEPALQLRQERCTAQLLIRRLRSPTSAHDSLCCRAPWQAGAQASRNRERLGVQRAARRIGAVTVGVPGFRKRPSVRAT